MGAEITIEGTEHSFPAEDGQTILDAAETAGFALPYSCRRGACDSCCGDVSTGSVVVGKAGPSRAPLTGVRFCQAVPDGPVTIVPKRYDRMAPPARKEIDTRLRKIAYPAADIAILSLRLPLGERAVFQAGQYLRVLFGDGESRNYSMANPPHKSDSLELHIRIVPGGRFSQQVLGGLAKGDTVRVRLPYGTFTVSAASARPAVCVVTGTGFAPIKSMLEDRIAAGDTRAIHLYWGARTARDLYAIDLARGWEERHGWLRFTPVLSEPDPGWSGRTGLVHDAILEDHPSLRGHDVFACGNPAMIAAAERDFTARGGLPEGAFFSDAFVATDA